MNAYQVEQWLLDVFAGLLLLLLMNDSQVEQWLLSVVAVLLLLLSDRLHSSRAFAT